MNIITHNTPKTQAKILANARQMPVKSKEYLSYDAHLTETQRHALMLYDVGMNVFPQPYGRKGGYPWKRLQFTRLHRNHHLYGIENLFVGQCNIAIMCGRTSGNLFVIDCESQVSFKYHLEELRKRNIPIWASRTKRGGHIYLRAINGEVHNIPNGTLLETEIKGRQGYILAPPSLHPSGKKYHWLYQEDDRPPAIDVKDIDWLIDNKNKPVSLKYDPVSQYVPGIRVDEQHGLSIETKQYIHKGHLIPEGNRNNRLFASACDLVANNYNYEKTLELLLPKALESGLNSDEIKRTIESAYRHSRQPSNEQIKQGDWYYALIFLANEQLMGVKSSSIRAIMLTLIERARIVHYHSNKNTFRASIREIASYAKLSTTTVQKGLQAISQLGWIEKRNYDDESLASTWCFSESILQKSRLLVLKSNTLAPLTPWLEYSVLLFNTDLVERRALGHGTLFLYRMIIGLHTPLMPSEIADFTGLTLNQVNYGLSKLRLFSLVERTSHGWIALSLNDAQVENLLHDSGALGKGQHRNDLFSLERQLFAGRFIYDARLKREGEAFLYAQSRRLRAFKSTRNWVDELLLDELVQEALELGAVIYCDDGFLIERRLE